MEINRKLDVWVVDPRDSRVVDLKRSGDAGRPTTQVADAQIADPQNIRPYNNGKYPINYNIN